MEPGKLARTHPRYMDKVPALLLLLALSLLLPAGEASGQPADVHPSREVLLEKARLNPVRVFVRVRMPTAFDPSSPFGWQDGYVIKERVLNRVMPLGATDVNDTGPSTLIMLVPRAALEALLKDPDVQYISEDVPNRPF
jgi:hypothetical protein